MCMPEATRHGLSLLAACLSLVAPSVAQDSAACVIAFPGKKIFPPFHADALAHQLSLSRVTDNREWIGTVGTSLPLAQVETGGLAFQIGVGATVFSRLIKTPGHVTVSTVDYKIDLPLDLDLHAVKLRAAYGHVSAHYADDAVEQLGKKSISAVKDYLALAAVRAAGFAGGFVYAGLTYAYHNEPEVGKPWLIQIGAEAGNVSVLDEVEAYGAIDLKFKEEVGWGTTQSYQVGVKIFPHPPYALRLCYTLRRGLEERGQLYSQSTTANLLTIALDY